MFRFAVVVVVVQLGSDAIRTAIKMQSGRPSERRYTHLPNLAPHVGAPLLFAANIKPAHGDEAHHLVEQRT
jgi:hypothetical protein